LALQAVVADGACGAEGFFDVAGFEDAETLFGMVGPDAGQEVGLQLEPHGKLIVFGLGHAAPHAADALGNAELVLHVMADFVGDDVGLGEVARRAKTVLQLAEKAQVEIDLLVGGAVERPDRGAGEAAGRADFVAEQHERGIAIPAAHLLELLLPHVLGAGQHDADEL
jgi:hypothetical protein